MSRTVLKIVCVGCGILFVFFSILTVLSVTKGMERINTSGGIIGGADTPTVGFLLHNSPLYYIALVALVLFIVTGAVLIFWNKHGK